MLRQKPRLRWEWGDPFQQQVLEIIGDYGPVSLREIGERIEQDEPTKAPLATSSIDGVVSILLLEGKIRPVGDKPVRYEASQ